MLTRCPTRRACHRRHFGERDILRSRLWQRLTAVGSIRSISSSLLANRSGRELQADGRIRYWAYIPRLGTYIRVITLADGYTVHNVFKDSDFSE